MALAVLCGCQTTRQKQSKEQSKEVSALRVYIEASAKDPAVNQRITLLRADPIAFTIEKEPILTEANLIQSRVIEAEGGFAIQIQFDESGGMVLEQYSAANPGKHFVVFGQWGEKAADGRWLAAPLITHRIAGGILSFTPDLSRTNADRLVLGLNNVSKKIIKDQFK